MVDITIQQEYIAPLLSVRSPSASRARQTYTSTDEKVFPPAVPKENGLTMGRESCGLPSTASHLHQKALLSGMSSKLLPPSTASLFRSSGSHHP